MSKSKDQLNAEVPKYESVVKYMVPVNSMITFRPDQEINEVIDIIIEKRISGAPVLDENRKLVGIISEKDCLRIIVDQAYHNLPHIFSQGFRLYDKRGEDFVTG